MKGGHRGETVQAEQGGAAPDRPGAVGQHQDGGEDETAGQTEADIWAEIARIRARPYYLWRNRQQYSSAYVGFVIADSAGRPHALVTIGGPMERFTEARMEALLPRMLAILEPLRQQCRLFPAAPVFLREGS